MGNTVLEAHASGIPVLVPRTQGFVDTVSHESDGFLYNPDSGKLDDVIQFLKSMRNDRLLCQRMGAAGRERVLKSSPDRVAADVVEWYERRVGIYQRAWLMRAILTLLPLSMAVLFVCTVWYAFELLCGSFTSLKGRLEQARSFTSSSPFVNSIKKSYSSLSMTPVVHLPKQKQEN